MRWRFLSWGLIQAGIELGHEIAFHLHPEKPTSVAPFEIHFSIKKKKGALGIEPLDGFVGQLVALSDDTLHYSHIPATSFKKGEAIVVLRSFSPGSYHAWFEFKDGGQIVVFPFHYDVR
jgi:hypothetical protein